MRNWNYPTRAAMVSYHHRAREAEVEIGYLLEGKADDELPEQHLGCFHSQITENHALAIGITVYWCVLSP